MRTFLGYTLSSERPPPHGNNHVSITQLCHEKAAFPTLFPTAPHLNQHPACEKCGLGTLARVYVAYMEKHPKLLDAYKSEGLFDALVDAYPCPVKNN
jgi:hypothetical protein